MAGRLSSPPAILSAGFRCGPSRLPRHLATPHYHHLLPRTIRAHSMAGRRGRTDSRRKTVPLRGNDYWMKFSQRIAANAADRWQTLLYYQAGMVTVTKLRWPW